MRNAVAGLVVLAGLFLALAAALPSRYELSRTIVIARPASELSQLVADFSSRTRWIPWAVTEPAARYTVAGTVNTAGATFSWSGKKIGEGTATLVQHRAGELVETALVMTRPMALRSTDSFRFEAIDTTHTRVTWSNAGALPYPVGRVFGLVIDHVVGADYALGLARLRALAEGVSPVVAVSR